MSCEDAGADKFPILDNYQPRPEHVQADGCPDAESAEAAVLKPIAETAETVKKAVEKYVCPNEQLWGV
jgi:hypothetical protein